MLKDQLVNESIKESVQPGAGDSVVAPPTAVTPTYLRPREEYPPNIPVRMQAASVVSQPPVGSALVKSKKRLRLAICCSGVCLLFFVFLAAGMPFILENILRSQAAEQAVMSRDNQWLWSKVPGESQTEFVRSFSFYNFSNWEDFYFYGSKPEFREIQGYQITEEQEDLDIEWLDNDQRVRFRYYLHFNEKKGTRNLNETIHVVNAAPLGFWYQLKLANQSQLFNQAMGILFTNLETIIKDVVLAQGIAAQYLPDFPTTWAGLFSPADISAQHALKIWNDITFGLNSQDKLAPWIISARRGLASEDAQKLGVYFGLTTFQLSSMLDYFGRVIETLNGVVFDNFYCGDGSECSGFRLAARQIVTSGVTNNTPPVKGIVPAETLCLKNSTCAGGLPEISIFYQKIFLPAHPGEEFANVSFDPSLAEGWFRHSKPVNTKQNCLLHAGNLEALFNNGTLYDQTANETYLDNIRQRFGGLTREQGIVFWAWIKHYLNQFVIKQELNGTKQEVGMGLVGTEWFYKSYSKAEDQLYNLVLQYKLLNLTSLTNCEKLMNDSVVGITDKAINNVCATYDIRNPQGVMELIYVCLNKFGVEWQKFQSIGNFSDYQMESLCDRESKDGLGGYMLQADIYLRDWYGCKMSPSGYCSNYELGCMQWANSTVTLKPIPELPQKYAKTTTARDWFKGVRAFEYGHFISKYPQQKLQRFTPQQSAYMINWGGLLSLFIVQKIMLSKDTSMIPPELGITDLKNFQNYIRYVVVFVAFDGFAKERSAYELIFGYNDGLLTYLKEEIDPCRGGDPSIPNFIHFNDENITKEDSTYIEMYSGKGNQTKTGYFNKLNGVDWININASKWNGNETYSYLKNPWMEFDQLEGTDGKQSAPNQFEVDQINVYVPNLLRHGTGKWSGDTYKRYGLEIYKGAISDDLYKNAEEDPRNAKYYAGYHGTLNLTSLNGFPIFSTKNHFKDSSKNWSELVEIWDENHTFIYEPSEWDDSYIHYEPYSGVTFSAVLYLQNNYLHTPDLLFPRNQTLMLPLFSINRGGNFSEAGVNKVFGLLKTGLTLKVVCLWGGIGMAVLMCILLALCIARYRKVSAKRNTDEEELLISMQEHQEQPVRQEQQKINASSVKAV